MLAPAETLLGHTLAAYRLAGVLDTGGMSTVYRGERMPDATEDGPSAVAIKVLRPPAAATHASQATFRARFRREAAAATALRHDAILPVLSYGEDDDGLLYMIQPLMCGGSLASRTAAGPLSLAEAAACAHRLADALDYAHAHGFVHRDVKPSNVLLDAEGRAYLADFGIARAYDPTGSGLSLADEDDSLTRLTTTGEIIGTPAYMSPEQFSGQPAGPASDVYSLGVLLYLLVTGQLPFAADTPMAIGMRHLHDTPVSPRLLRSELPIPAAAAILRALAKSPAERFASAGAFAEAFGSGLAGRWTAANAPLLAATGASPTVGAPVRFAPVDAPAPRLWPSRPERSSRLALLTLLARPIARKVAALALIVLLLFGGIFALAHLGPSTAGATHPPAAARTTHSTSAPTSSPAPTATSAPKVAERYAYNGSLLTGLTSSGAQVWRFTANGQIEHLSVRGGDVIISTSQGTTYTLRGSDGSLLSTSQQSAQPPAPKHGGGHGGHGGGHGGGDGGGDGGD